MKQHPRICELPHQTVEEEDECERRRIRRANAPACRYCPDETCPEDCPECGAPIHDLGETPPRSAAYARLEKAAKEAAEAAHLHAMHGMKRVYQLCRTYGTDTMIPAAEVLKALGLDENANIIDTKDTP